MSQQKPTKPPAKPPAAQGEINTPPTPTAPPARTRSAVSMQTKLAIALAGVLALIARKEVAAVLKPEDQEGIKNAIALADESNKKSLGPINARLEVIKTDLAAAVTPENIVKVGASDVIKKLSSEMGRLETKRKALVERASA